MTLKRRSKISWLQPENMGVQHSLPHILSVLFISSFRIYAEPSYCCFQLQLLPSVHSDTVLCNASSTAAASFIFNKFPGEKYTREKDLEQTSREILSVLKTSRKLLEIAFFTANTDWILTNTWQEQLHIWPGSADEPPMVYKEFRWLYWVFIDSWRWGRIITLESEWILFISDRTHSLKNSSRRCFSYINLDPIKAFHIFGI